MPLSNPENVAALTDRIDRLIAEVESDRKASEARIKKHDESIDAANGAASKANRGSRRAHVVAVLALLVGAIGVWNGCENSEAADARSEAQCRTSNGTRSDITSAFNALFDGLRDLGFGPEGSAAVESLAVAVVGELPKADRDCNNDGDVDRSDFPS